MTLETATTAIFAMSDDTECQGADKVTLYEEIGGAGWRESHVKFCEAFEGFRNQGSSTLVIFASSETIRDCENPPYDISDFLSPESSFDPSTGRKPILYNCENGEHVSHSYFSVWSPGTGTGPRRIIRIASVLTIWQPRSGVGVVLYINIPLHVQKRLGWRALAGEGRGTGPKSSPCSWHITLTKEICGSYAQYARELKDRVDIMGKEDVMSTNILQSIEALATQCSLLTNALDNAEFTMQSLFTEQISWHRYMDPVTLRCNMASKSIESGILLLERRIHGMKLRSRMLERTLASITSHALMALDMDARRHRATGASVRKAIVVVGLVALPVFFSNAIFQMNTFAFRASDSRDVKWVVSHSLRVYWVVTGSFILVSLIGWVTWRYLPGFSMVRLEWRRPTSTRTT
ncbi:hypothetical protein BJX99DRAFT_253952 [Aspergillus californicus]